MNKVAIYLHHVLLTSSKFVMQQTTKILRCLYRDLFRKGPSRLCLHPGAALFFYPVHVWHTERDRSGIRKQNAMSFEINLTKSGGNVNRYDLRRAYLNWLKMFRFRHGCGQFTNSEKLNPVFLSFNFYSMLKYARI